MPNSESILPAGVRRLGEPRILRQGQDALLEGEYQYLTHSVRVQISVDTEYVDQSSAACERWDGTAWREVARLQYSELGWEEKVIHSREYVETVLRAAEEKLLQRAGLVLGRPAREPGTRV